MFLRTYNERTTKTKDKIFKKENRTGENKHGGTNNNALKHYQKNLKHVYN